MGAWGVRGNCVAGEGRTLLQCPHSPEEDMAIGEIVRRKLIGKKEKGLRSCQIKQKAQKAVTKESKHKVHRGKPPNMERKEREKGRK